MGPLSINISGLAAIGSHGRKQLLAQLSLREHSLEQMEDNGSLEGWDFYHKHTKMTDRGCHII